MGTIGLAGPASLRLLLGRLASACLASAGAPPSPRRPLVLAEAVGEGRQQSRAEWGAWRVDFGLEKSSGRGYVICSYLDCSTGQWVAQDTPDGTPSQFFVERGENPSGQGDQYHFVRRTVCCTMGKCWDPSPATPAEVSYREDGTVSWTRRYFAGHPADRGLGYPALQSYWETGHPKMYRYASSTSASDTPCYAEFYPDGGIAVEATPSGVFRAYFPDGHRTQYDANQAPQGKECALVFAAATPVNFDASMLSPYSAFLDKFPDGAWRVHKCLHPGKLEKHFIPKPSLAYVPPLRSAPRLSSGHRAIGSSAHLDTAPPPAEL